MIQKPLEKYAKVYELLGRPVFIRKSLSNSNKSLSKNDSLSTSFGASNAKFQMKKQNSDVWKKIQDFTIEFNNNVKENTEKKREFKEIKDILDIKDDIQESSGLKDNKKYEKVTFAATNLFLEIKHHNHTSKKKTPHLTNPLLEELMLEFNKETSKNAQNTKKNEKDEKNNEEIADEIIKEFFEKSEGILYNYMIFI